MKKLFIAVILLAAAGSIFYYYQQFKKNKPPQLSSRELIIGNWSIDSLAVSNKDSNAQLRVGLIPASDSNYLRYQYHFREDGKVLKSLPGNSSDTSVYEWKDEKTLYWKEKFTDSTGEYLQLLSLDSNRLVLQSKDSVSLFFTKKK